MTPETLRLALQQRELSIRQAAPILGVHYSTLAQYLTGAMPITQTRADSIGVRLRRYDESP